MQQPTVEFSFLKPLIYWTSRDKAKKQSCFLAVLFTYLTTAILPLISCTPDSRILNFLNQISCFLLMTKKLFWDLFNFNYALVIWQKEHFFKCCVLRAKLFVNPTTLSLQLFCFLFFRRNINRLCQVLLYARRIFYKIDMKNPLNPEAAHL